MVDTAGGGIFMETFADVFMQFIERSTENVAMKKVFLIMIGNED